MINHLNIRSGSRGFVLAFCLIFTVWGSNAQPLTGYVDPYIGSGGHGHVFVGASVPFGAVQLGPENFYKGWDWCSGYNYGDSVVIGFAHTHLSGTGIGDLADVLIMPYTGSVRTDKGTEKNTAAGYASHYSHKTESVKPGYYSVKLTDHDISVELTASERVGFHQYHFPTEKEAHVIIDLKEGINDQSTGTCIKTIDKYTISGYRFSSGWAKDQRLFFAIRSSEPIEKFAVYDNDKLLPGDSAKGKAVKGLISFDKTPATLKLKVSISPVSSENALKNIETEIPGWNFNQVAISANEKWNRELSKIRIETKKESDKRIFYTSLYHTMINPALFNDHNTEYRGADKEVYAQPGFTNYSVFSLWDTYRANNPLFTLTQQDKVDDMINSMLAIYRQQGKLPIWHLMGNETGTMVGISSLQVIAEAYLKGFKGFNADSAFAAIKATAMSSKLGLKYVQDFKAIPSDEERRSVAKALEYSISDGSIALMAQKLGRMEDYNYFLKRSRNYKLYYDPETKFFRGKRTDGKWSLSFDPFKSVAPWSNDYAEGNSWQYLWLVPQDVKGLISLLGGEQAFLSRLDSFFVAEPAVKDTNALVDITGTIGQYAHGNEPSHHITYLYAYAGQQWKTAEKTRYILKEMYHDNPDGIIGNEDCGQISAWYIFSALGFYPVFPASGAYVFGSPLYDKATISLPGGRKFIIQAVDNGPENIYIQRVELNGKRYDKSYILHSNIINGDVLKVFMGSKPNFDFGKMQEDRP